MMARGPNAPATYRAAKADSICLPLPSPGDSETGTSPWQATEGALLVRALHVRLLTILVHRFLARRAHEAFVGGGFLGSM